MNTRGKEVDCIQSANDECVSTLCMANVADWVAHGLFLIQVGAVRDRAGKFRQLNHIFQLLQVPQALLRHQLEMGHLPMPIHRRREVIPPEPKGPIYHFYSHHHSQQTHTGSLHPLPQSDPWMAICRFGGHSICTRNSRG